VCGAPATHAGHIIDVAQGGTATLDNLRAECVRCNCGAGARLAAYRATARARHPVFSMGGVDEDPASVFSLSPE
jgi:5-methylcytosine-specific restriction endonuclease McrA